MAYLTDSGKQRALLITILVSGFTTMMNSSTVNIALPSFMTIFQVDIPMAQWIMVGYMLTLGMAMPLVGYVGDRYSYRKVYLVALVVMGLSAAACAMANDIYTLIACRMIKGMAAGFITPCTMTLLYRYIPKNKQASYLGLSVMASSLGPAVGPSIAGLLLAVFNWHSLFLINVPLVLIAFYLGFKSIPKEEPNRAGHLDLLGIFMVAIGTILVLIAFTKVEAWGWGSVYFLMCIFAGVMLIASFIFQEYRSEEPLLNFKVFQYKPFTLCVVVTCSMAIALNITPVLLAIYLQNILGHTPLEAGMILLFPAMLMVLGNFLSRLLIKQLTNRFLIVGGLTTAAVGTFLMSKAGLETTVFMIILYLSLRYFGMGLVNMPLTNYGMSVVPMSLSGHASSMLSWCRQLISTVAVNILTAMLSIRMSYHYLSNGNMGPLLEGSKDYNLAQMQGVNDIFSYAVVILLLTAALGLLTKSKKTTRS